MWKESYHVLLLAVLLILIAAAAYSENRPDTWAQPVTLEGVPNLHKVTDNLYRSAQPTADGMRCLKELGIKTIVSLRAFHSDLDELGDTGIRAVHIRMGAWHPEEEDAVRFLKIALDPQQTPVLVHCQHGADRTGAMVAIYRIAVQGWSREEATREMTEGGYGFHEVWANLKPWIEGVDIERIRREAGVP